MRPNVGNKVTMAPVPDPSKPGSFLKSPAAHDSRFDRGLLLQRGSMVRLPVLPPHDRHGTARFTIPCTPTATRLGPISRVDTSGQSAALENHEMHEAIAAQPRRNGQHRPLRKMPQTSLLMFAP